MSRHGDGGDGNASGYGGCGGDGLNLEPRETLDVGWEKALSVCPSSRKGQKRPDVGCALIALISKTVCTPLHYFLRLAQITIAMTFISK